MHLIVEVKCIIHMVPKNGYNRSLYLKFVEAISMLNSNELEDILKIISDARNLPYNI